MQNWEYQTLERTRPPVRTELNELGSQGWELVNILHITDIINGYYCYFKRLKADEPAAAARTVPAEAGVEQVDINNAETIADG